MTSSVNTCRQPTDGDGEPSISPERFELASIPGSLGGLESNQRNETSVLSDAQRQSKSEIEVKSTEGEKEERNEVQQQEEEEGEGGKQRERDEAFRRVMKDLEDTTGFGSYQAYLKSLHRDPMYVGRSYTEISAGCDRYPHDDGDGVDVIDLLSEDLSSVEVSLRRQKLQAREIAEALCHPPPNTRAQIVLWSINFITFTKDIKDFLDVLGVGLRLDPCFFEAWRRRDETRISHHLRSKNILCMRSIGTSAFVAHSFVLAQDNPVPVVLIGGSMHQTIEMFSYDALCDPEPLTNKAIYDLVRSAPLYGHYYSHGHWGVNRRPCFANIYIRVLTTLLKSDRESVLSSSDILSACMIPLLQIEIAICKGDIDHLRNLFSGSKTVSRRVEEFGFEIDYRGGLPKFRGLKLPDGETLYSYRTKLRSWIEYFENESGALMDLLSSLLGANVTTGVFYPQIKEESISIAEEASRLEAEIRDHLQLEASKLALEESRKSIELSNYQIYEGKRVKIFTILAFFYVPLNLATSIYGMNIQQLNSNGTSIGVFLGTAVMLLFVTGMIWFSIEGIQDARVFLRRVLEDKDSDPPQDPSIFVRIYLIWWLSRSGLFKWMLRTGAGWCLLINSSLKFRPFRPRPIFDMAIRQRREPSPLSNMEYRSAPEFVLKILSDGPRLWKCKLNDDTNGGWYVWHEGYGQCRMKIYRRTHRYRR